MVDEKAKASEVNEKSRAQCEKADTQLCRLLWQSIDFKLTPYYLVHTCYSVWKNAHALNTSDVSSFYDVISQMTNLKETRITYFYLGQVLAVMEEFERLMSFTTNEEKQ